MRAAELHQPSVLRCADDVEGEQDVVGDAGIDEDLGLAELLAGQADGAGRDLHGCRSRESCGS